MRYLYVCVLMLMMASCRSYKESTTMQRRAELISASAVRMDSTSIVCATMNMKGRYHIIWYDTDKPVDSNGRHPVAAEVYAEEEKVSSDSTLAMTTYKTENTTSVKVEEDYTHEEESDSESDSARWRAWKYVTVAVLMIVLYIICKRTGIVGLLRGVAEYVMEKMGR